MDLAPAIGSWILASSCPFSSRCTTCGVAGSGIYVSVRLCSNRIQVNGSVGTSRDRVMAPAEITEDYYAVLEVSQTACPDTIRKSYRRLAVLLHPDKNPNKPNATAAFQLVSLALVRFREAIG